MRVLFTIVNKIYVILKGLIFNSKQLYMIHKGLIYHSKQLKARPIHDTLGFCLP